MSSHPATLVRGLRWNSLFLLKKVLQLELQYEQGTSMMNRKDLKRRLLKDRLVKIRWSRLKKDTCCPRCERQTLITRHTRKAVIHDCSSCGYLMAWDREQLRR